MFANENAYDDLIASYASTAGVPVPLVKAIIATESGFDPRAEALTGGDAARGGSYGLMQMSLATAKGMGFQGDPTALLDPATNLAYGIRFLGYMYAAAKGDVAMTAARYNGGHALGGGKYSDQSYVSQVTNYLRYFTPPPADATAVIPDTSSADAQSPDEAAADTGALLLGGMAIIGIVWAAIKWFKP